MQRPDDPLRKLLGQEAPEGTPFLVEFRNNLPEIEKLLEAWFVNTIHTNRPWWKYTTEIPE